MNPENGFFGKARTAPDNKRVGSSILCRKKFIQSLAYSWSVNTQCFEAFV